MKGWKDEWKDEERMKRWMNELINEYLWGPVWSITPIGGTGRGMEFTGNRSK